MRTTAIISLLLFTIYAVYGQLNFEGNPLTEDTVYTAEESQFAEKTAKSRSLLSNTPKRQQQQQQETEEDSYLLAAKSLQAARNQNIYKISNDNVAENHKYFSSSNNEASSSSSSSTNPYKTIKSEVMENTPAPLVVDADLRPQSWYINGKTQEQKGNQQAAAIESAEIRKSQFINPSESALAMFLNSKTPQESEIALNQYLTSAGQKPQPHVSEIVLPQQQSINANQQINENDRVDTARYANSGYLDPQPVQSFSANWQPHDQYKKNLMPIRRPPLVAFGRRSFPVKASYRAPFYRAQQRISVPSGYHNSPAYGPGKDGLEVIYTRPPGFGKGQYQRGKNPDTDAGAWFPDANYPPPDVNVYQSQLYAQSYDPHYYNYIAKYGKIKPHLYGKFEKKEEGLLAELFASFKKHGMKHMMDPMFLLGLGIPMVTLMLSALVSKSFSRSISARDINGNVHVTDEEINEWTTKLRKALECHANSTSEIERLKCPTISD